VTPEVSIITQIDFDHEAYLGHSLEEIAAEKAGIIKPESIVVSAAERPEARAVIARRCKDQHARLVEIDDAWRINEIVPDDLRQSRDSRGGSPTAPSIQLQIPLAGNFQVRNALTAAAAAKVLTERGICPRRSRDRARSRKSPVARPPRARRRAPGRLSRWRAQSRRGARTPRVLG
jgi:dihydrofolate synthase/folylpolyglutamate synthase